jgi:hypothetical protein
MQDAKQQGQGETGGMEMGDTQPRENRR